MFKNPPRLFVFFLFIFIYFFSPILHGLIIISYPSHQRKQEEEEARTEGAQSEQLGLSLLPVETQWKLSAVDL